MAENHLEHIPRYLQINKQRIEPSNLNELEQESIRDFLGQWWNDTDYIEQKTSGSTGQPKIIQIKKNSMVASARMTIERFSLAKNQTALLCLPVNFIAGRMMIVRALVAEMKLFYFSNNANPLEQAEKLDYDFCAMLPLQVANSIEHHQEDFEKIKQVIIGGAEISFSLLQKIERCKNLCYATFGMTETVSHIATKCLNGKTKSEAYALFKTIHVDVDERNCLIVNAPQLHHEKLITNDVVEFVDLDKFIWKGRFDHVINSGGLKIYPEEMEKQLAPLLDPKLFFISSLPDEKLGEKIVLLIEGEALDNYTEGLLKKQMQDLFPSHLQPKHILYADKFALTPTQKIKRKESLALCLSIS